MVSLAPVSPVAEGIEQVLPHSLRQILFGQLPRGADRCPELPQILRAAGAPYQVLLHLGPGALVESTVHELGEQLHDVLADRILRPDLAHGATSAAHPASAWRTLVRARCRSTRWLASLIFKASHTSDESQSSMSLRVITCRWFGGSFSISALIRTSAWASARRSSAQRSGPWAQCPGQRGSSGGRKPSTGRFSPSAFSDSSAEKGTDRASRPPRSFAQLTRIRNIQ